MQLLMRLPADRRQPRKDFWLTLHPVDHGSVSGQASNRKGAAFAHPPPLPTPPAGPRRELFKRTSSTLRGLLLQRKC